MAEQPERICVHGDYPPDQWNLHEASGSRPGSCNAHLVHWVDTAIGLSSGSCATPSFIPRSDFLIYERRLEEHRLVYTGGANQHRLFLNMYV